MKVHLATVEGGVYCHTNNRTGFSEAALKSSPKISEVTCLRCIRRYCRLPITARMDKHRKIS